ncbi:MAG: hypothetical protein HUU41_14045 [Bryobacteraceae bacterium]|nr:hypothetical protein [Bryobacteraceae bacterium]
MQQLGRVEPGCDFRVSETFEPAAGPMPSLTFANAFPGAGTVGGNPTLATFSRDRRTPYHQQWNFTLEYELLPNTAVRASYIGNMGTHLERSFNLNDPPPASWGSTAATAVSTVRSHHLCGIRKKFDSSWHPTLGHPALRFRFIVPTGIPVQQSAGGADVRSCADG